MQVRNFSQLIYTIAFLSAIGCSGGHASAPVLPPEPANPDSSGIAISPLSNHHLLGLWDVAIDESGRVEAAPIRTAQMHLNATELLEQHFPDCLIIDNVDFNFLGHNGRVDVTVKRPPGFPMGFDARGIVISEPGFLFPASQRSIPNTEKFRLINGEGYTELFNPVEFLEESPLPDYLKYYRGKFASESFPSATLNPYICFFEDQPRRATRRVGFQQWPTKTFLFEFEELPIRFGYALDVSWAPRINNTGNYMIDFPPEANCHEAYQVFAYVPATMLPNQSDGIIIHVEVSDHQGLDTIESVTAECPSVWAGETALQFDQQLDDETWLFSGEVVNSLNAPAGDYPVLARVRDTQPDPNLGDISAWALTQIDVSNGWVRTFADSGNNNWAWDVVTRDGRIFACGVGGGDFDPGPKQDVGDGYGLNWVATFLTDGTYLWTKRWDGFHAHAIEVDSQGTIYVAGNFRGEKDFDPSSGEYYMIALDTFSPYLLTLDPDGNFIRAYTWGGGGTPADQGSSMAFDLALDIDDNLLVTGSVEGPVDLDPGPGIDIHDGYDKKVFLQKFAPDGSYIWGKTWAVEDGHANGFGVDQDSLGNIYVEGSIRGICDFDPSENEDIQGRAGNSEYLTSLDSEGNYRWARTWGVTLTRSMWAEAIGVDSNDKIYIGGVTMGNEDLDPGPDEFKTLQSGGYVSRFNQAGEYLGSLFFKGDGPNTFVSDIEPTSTGVVVSGACQGTFDIDPGLDEILYELPGSGIYGRKGFLASLDFSGKYLWGHVWGSDHYYNVADLNELTVDYNDNIYTGGGYRASENHPIDFDPSDLTEFRYPGYYDNGVFLMKNPPDGNW